MCDLGGPSALDGAVHISSARTRNKDEMRAAMIFIVTKPDAYRGRGRVSLKAVTNYVSENTRSAFSYKNIRFVSSVNSSPLRSLKHSPGINIG